ncbi:MAG: serine/threonine protein kinase [Elusimicrobia bacterium]|nr:serine/threonine protein kinase [Elusimicrobiota bacterium]
MQPTLLLALLLLPLPWARAADAQPAQDPSRERMAVLRSEIESLMTVMEPKLSSLERLSEAYAQAKDPRPLFANRAVLQNDLSKDLDHYSQIEDEFNTLRANADVGSIAVMIQAFTSGKGLPPGVESAYFQYNDALEFGRMARGFHERVERSRAADEIKYRAALQAYDTRQRWIIGTSIVGAALTVLIGLLFYMRVPAGHPTVMVTASPRTAPGGASPAALPAPSPPSEGRAGDVLGSNYRIERILGRGGMGVVYEAVDLTLQRKVAIKRMTDDLLNAGHDLELFVNEARLVAQLKHSHIVEIHSILREGGLLHLVFEYVEGRPLSSFLGNGQRLNLHSAKGVVRQVASALDYAHSRKVIHRDLKPSNIMVGRGGAVKVMDFGIAHQAKLTVAKATRTAAWGTPPYMAPEQELGHASRETDLFSLGVCLYEMLTTQIPFTGPNFLAQKRERIYTPASRLAPELTPAVDAVIARSLAPDPKDRFHSGAEFSAALDAVKES